MKRLLDTWEDIALAWTTAGEQAARVGDAELADRCFARAEATRSCSAEFTEVWKQDIAPVLRYTSDPDAYRFAQDGDDADPPSKEDWDKWGVNRAKIALGIL